MNQGYLYTAYGKAHIFEAIKSVESLRQIDKEAHVTLVTTGNANRSYDFSKFDHVITSPHLCAEYLGGKVERMYSFYEKTLYLDTDTWICEPLQPLFDHLDDYDIVVAPDPGEVEVEGYVAPNTGVVAYRASGDVDDFLNLYRLYYFKKELWHDHPGRKQRTDQPAFALALRDSGVKTLWVPQNWNARYRFWCSLHPGPVKIVHGLDCEFTLIRRAMNDKLGNRCWNPDELKLC